MSYHGQNDCVSSRGQAHDVTMLYCNTLESRETSFWSMAHYRKFCFVYRVLVADYPDSRAGSTSAFHLSRGKLSDSLGPLGHSVLHKLTREHEAHGRLDLGHRCMQKA